MRALLQARGSAVGVLAFMTVSLVLTLCVAGTLARSGPSNTITISAMFRDASGLRTGDDVLVAGVRVGTVKATGLEGTLARVTMSIDASQHLRRATVASIAFLNLMGQRYVDLSGGPAGPPGELRNGDTIPITQTRPGLDLTALFNAFQPIFADLQPAQINQLARNLVSILQGEGPTLRDLTRQTADLLGHVARRSDAIGQVIDNVAVVLRTAQAHRSQLVSLLHDLGGLTHDVAQDRRAIASSLTSVQQLTSLAAGLTTRMQPSVNADVMRLRQLTGTFASLSDPFSTALAATAVQLAVYTRSLGWGSFLNVYVCRTSVAVPGHRVTPLGAHFHSARCRG